MIWSDTSMRDPLVNAPSHHWSMFITTILNYSNQVEDYKYCKVVLTRLCNRNIWRLTNNTFVQMQKIVEGSNREVRKGVDVLKEKRHISVCRTTSPIWSFHRSLVAATIMQWDKLLLWPKLYYYLIKSRQSGLNTYIKCFMQTIKQVIKDFDLYEILSNQWIPLHFPHPQNILY